ncbi:MAG: hypothetical protein RMI91_13750 [Gemmatales bacterium]|nr:hypothetical protein [Gemmatales bacterium]MDW7995709.1 hypothetical protein [Gemmatales bacterium]
MAKGILYPLLGLSYLALAIAFVGIALRGFALVPLFLLDGYSLLQAIRWNIKVTAGWKWAYWLVLLLIGGILGMVSTTVMGLAQVTVAKAVGQNLVAGLVGIVVVTVISAVFSPLVVMPMAVAYVEMMKQLRKKVGGKT